MPYIGNGVQWGSQTTAARIGYLNLHREACCLNVQSGQGKFPKGTRVLLCVIGFHLKRMAREACGCFLTHRKARFMLRMPTDLLHSMQLIEIKRNNTFPGSSYTTIPQTCTINPGHRGFNFLPRLFFSNLVSRYGHPTHRVSCPTRYLTPLHQTV